MVQNQKEKIIITGIVIEALPNALFRVLASADFKNLFSDKTEVLGRLSGKIRINHIKILVGDKVKVELSPYDLTKGRIIQRF